MEPPPGATDSLAVSLAKVRRFMPTSRPVFAPPRSLYSMIFSFGSNGVSSSSPMLLMAMWISSSSLTPVERCCFSRKYFPASSMACSGIRPTSSLPVTRIPLLYALLTHSSKAICTGVMLILVRFMLTCASPYSSIYQPMAFTALQVPGMRTASPLASLAPDGSTRPCSLTSKATELARRVEVVLRLTL